MGTGPRTIVAVFHLPDYDPDKVVSVLRRELRAERVALHAVAPDGTLGSLPVPIAPVPTTSAPPDTVPTATVPFAPIATIPIPISPIPDGPTASEIEEGPTRNKAERPQKTRLNEFQKRKKQLLTRLKDPLRLVEITGKTGNGTRMQPWLDMLLDLVDEGKVTYVMAQTNRRDWMFVAEGPDARRRLGARCRALWPDQPFHDRTTLFRRVIDSVPANRDFASLVAATGVSDDKLRRTINALIETGHLRKASGRADAYETTGRRLPEPLPNDLDTRTPRGGRRKDTRSHLLELLRRPRTVLDMVPEIGASTKAVQAALDALMRAGKVQCYPNQGSRNTWTYARKGVDVRRNPQRRILPEGMSRILNLLPPRNAVRRADLVKAYQPTIKHLPGLIQMGFVTESGTGFARMLALTTAGFQHKDYDPDSPHLEEVDLEDMLDADMVRLLLAIEHLGPCTVQTMTDAQTHHMANIPLKVAMLVNGSFLEERAAKGKGERTYAATGLAKAALAVSPTARHGLTPEAIDFNMRRAASLRALPKRRGRIRDILEVLADRGGETAEGVAESLPAISGDGIMGRAFRRSQT